MRKIILLGSLICLVLLGAIGVLYAPVQNSGLSTIGFVLESLKNTTQVTQADVRDGRGGRGGRGWRGPWPFWCFIATSVYGENHRYTNVLRKFRDECLLTNSVGKEFVIFYYDYSPYVAGFLDENEYLKPVAGVLLLPVVGVATIATK
jgi:hypothetical protein